jgi:hypothetical protein
MYHYRAVMHRVHVQPTLLYAIQCLALMIARADLPRVHQVNPPPAELIGQERYSLVYLCRGRPDAVMDTVKLNSPVLGPAYWCAPTVAC